MKDIRKLPLRDAKGKMIFYPVQTPDDCSRDARRGSCQIKRYIHPESGAIITEQDWCTKHGKERGLYK